MITAFGMWKQKDHKFKVSLSSVAMVQQPWSSGFSSLCIHCALHPSAILRESVPMHGQASGIIVKNAALPTSFGSFMVYQPDWADFPCFCTLFAFSIDVDTHL